MRIPNITFLIGSGVSASIGVPTSREILEIIERKLRTDPSWARFAALHQIVRAGILYHQTLTGVKNPKIHAELVIETLENLERSHLRYIPFVGTWSQELNDVLGGNYSLISEFRARLQDFIKTLFFPQNYTFKALQNLEYIALTQQDPLRIFTTNHDLVLEQNLRETLEDDELLELGFEEASRDRNWNPERFFRTVNDGKRVKYYIYKLHGSVDWERDEQTDVVMRVDRTNRPELIYGTPTKFRYSEPYLFLFSELRRHCLRANYIITVGFSFSDDHINGIILNAMNESSVPTKLLGICYGDDAEDILNNRLGLRADLRSLELRERIRIITDLTAQDFFEDVIFGLDTIETLFKQRKFNVVSTVSLIPKAPKKILILASRKVSYDKIRKLLGSVSDFNFTETLSYDDVFGIFTTNQSAEFESWCEFLKTSIPLGSKERQFSSNENGSAEPDVIVVDSTDMLVLRKIGRCLTPLARELVRICESGDLRQQFAKFLGADLESCAGEFTMKFLYYLLTNYKRAKITEFVLNNKTLRNDYFAKFFMRMVFVNPHTTNFVERLRGEETLWGSLFEKLYPSLGKLMWPFVEDELATGSTAQQNTEDPKRSESSYEVSSTFSTLFKALSERSEKLRKAMILKILKDYLRTCLDELPSLNKTYRSTDQSISELGPAPEGILRSDIQSKYQRCQSVGSLLQEALENAMKTVEQSQIAKPSTNIDELLLTGILPVLEEFLEISLKKRLSWCSQCLTTERDQKTTSSVGGIESERSANVVSRLRREVLLSMLRYEVPILSCLPDECSLLKSEPESEVRNIVASLQANLEKSIIRTVQTLPSHGLKLSKANIWRLAADLTAALRRNYKEDDVKELYNKILRVADFSSVTQGASFGPQNALTNLIAVLAAQKIRSTMKPQDGEMYDAKDDVFELYELMIANRDSCVAPFALDHDLEWKLYLFADLLTQNSSQSQTHTLEFYQRELVAPLMRESIKLLSPSFLDRKINELVCTLTECFLQVSCCQSDSEKNLWPDSVECTRKPEILDILCQEIENWAQKNLKSPVENRKHLHKFLEYTCCTVLKFPLFERKGVNPQDSEGRSEVLRSFLKLIIEEELIPLLIVGVSDFESLKCRINKLVKKVAYDMSDEKGYHQVKDCESTEVECWLNISRLSEIIQSNLIELGTRIWLSEEMLNLIRHAFSKIVLSTSTYEEALRTFASSIQDLLPVAWQSHQLSEAYLLESILIILRKFRSFFDKCSCDLQVNYEPLFIDETTRKNLEDAVGKLMQVANEFDRYIELFVRRNISHLTDVIKARGIQISDTDILNAFKNIVGIFTAKSVLEVLGEFIQEFLCASTEGSFGEETFAVLREKLNSLHTLIARARTGVSPVDYNRLWTLRVIDLSHQLMEVSMTDFLE